jgi:hypothetical protein
MAQDGDVHVRRDARDGVGRPVPGLAREDSSRMMFPLGTFRLEHDVLSDKSNGELFPTAMFRAGRGYFLTNSASEAV